MQVPNVSVGGGVFSGRYACQVESASSILSECLQGGLRLIDTSPFYGDSEIIIGRALQTLPDTLRADVLISTKVGRYDWDKFDYSPERIRTSIAESRRRLGVTHLDVVFLHDVEFLASDMDVIYLALATLFDLRRQGVVKHVGISGYPLPILLTIAQHQHGLSQPLDAVLSYCHLTLQNTRLLDYIPQFRKAQVSLIFNASPLSMGLLRDSSPPDWHPAPPELRQQVFHIAQELKAKFDMNIADLAIRYAAYLGSMHGIDTLVIGTATRSDAKAAVDLLKNMESCESFGLSKVECNQ